MPQVLLISELFPPRIGGSGRWLWEVYRRFPRHAVVIAGGEAAGQEAFDAEHDVHVVRGGLNFTNLGLMSPAGMRRYWKALRHVRQIIKHESIANLHCARCLPEGLVAWIMKRWSGLPYVCFVHGEELNIYANSRELRYWARKAMRGADMFVANSRNTLRLLVKDWGISEDRIHLLHPGVDTAQFRPSQYDSQRRIALGWANRRVVLTVSRLQKRKGHDMLLRALPEIRQSVPDVLYAIVGSGEERAELEHLVGKLGLAECVQFRGEATDAEMIECYQQCDLFALPNREVDGDFEGFGMVLVEAQACGKPVLAGRSGGTAETMLVGQTGVVVDCTKPEGLARSVIELMLDNNRREQMGHAGRKWVVRQFDWEVLSNQAMRLLRCDAQARDTSDVVDTGAGDKLP